MPSTLHARVNLNHTTPLWVESGALFFVTGCCRVRGMNQLCRPEVAPALLNAVEFFHQRHRWFCRLFVLMPDHFHALIAPARDRSLGRVVGDWKRYTTNQLGIEWQHNFFDHRIRSDESWEQKAEYMKSNPIRAGLINEGETWPYALTH